jgi:outer membrane biosynthesis protein TonB
MTSRAWVFGLSALCAACAARSMPSPKSSTPAADTCTSYTQPGISAETAQRLRSASNALEYENIWRASQPGTTTGSVSGSAVRMTIRANTPEIQACYEAALLNSNETGGRVVVRFVIDSNGHVPSASIGSSELRAPELGCCVVKRVVQWTFPKPESAGFVVVEYPFTVHIAKTKD